MSWTVFGFIFYQSKTISFTQNSQCFLLGIKIVQVKSCDFTGPCPRVFEKMQNSIITEAIFFCKVNRVKDIKDFIGIQEADEIFLCTFFGGC